MKLIVLLLSLASLAGAQSRRIVLCTPEATRHCWTLTMPTTDAANSGLTVSSTEWQPTADNAVGLGDTTHAFATSFFKSKMTVSAASGTALDVTGSSAVAGALATHNNSGLGIRDTSLNGGEFSEKLVVNSAHSSQITFGDPTWQPATDNVIILGDTTHAFATSFFKSKMTVSAATGTALDVTGSSSVAGALATHNNVGLGIRDTSLLGAEFSELVTINSAHASKVLLGDPEWQPATDNTVGLGDSTHAFATSFFKSKMTISTTTGTSLDVTGASGVAGALATHNNSGLGIRDTSLNGIEISETLVVNSAHSSQITFGDPTWLPATDNVIILGDTTHAFATSFFKGKMTITLATGRALDVTGAGGTEPFATHNNTGPGYIDTSLSGITISDKLIVNNGNSGATTLGSATWQPADDVVSLGDSSHRFKHLRLSGDVTNIHGITTQSFGVPVVVYASSSGGLTASTNITPQVNGGTPPAGLYRVSMGAYINNCGAGAVAMEVNWPYGTGGLNAGSGPAFLGCGGTSNQFRTTFTLYYPGSGSFTVGTGGVGFVAFTGGSSYDFYVIVERL